jgi:hypothetical protein
MSARTKISTKPKKAVCEVQANYHVITRRAIDPRQNLILNKCKQALQKYFGERLKKVILITNSTVKESILFESEIKGRIL